LYGGYAEGRLKRARTPEEKQEAAIFQSMIKLGWGQGNLAFRKIFASLFLPGGTAEQHQSFVELQRASSSPENAERLIGTSYHIDVVALAPQVRVPTLVLHADRDQVVRDSQARLLASLIPGARLVLLEGENHILREDEPAWARFLDEITRFVR
jgi:pimeloyl-ACP methyl ester carboxylesterase